MVHIFDDLKINFFFDNLKIDFFLGKNTEVLLFFFTLMTLS